MAGAVELAESPAWRRRFAGSEYTGTLLDSFFAAPFGPIHIGLWPERDVTPAKRIPARLGLGFAFSRGPACSQSSRGGLDAAPV